MGLVSDSVQHRTSALFLLFAQHGVCRCERSRAAVCVDTAVPCPTCMLVGHSRSTFPRTAGLRSPTRTPASPRPRHGLGLVTSSSRPRLCFFRLFRKTLRFMLEAFLSLLSSPRRVIPTSASPWRRRPWTAVLYGTGDLHLSPGRFGYGARRCLVPPKSCAAAGGHLFRLRGWVLADFLWTSVLACLTVVLPQGPTGPCRSLGCLLSLCCCVWWGAGAPGPGGGQRHTGLCCCCGCGQVGPPA